MKRQPRWLGEAVFYQIYPQSFKDSNGDGIGDINGIIEKLDYIKSVGCDAVWLSPVYVSPFGDGGYDVADHYKVAPRYGTNADMKRLFTTASRKGMRIVLDLVAGHTSVEHAWFKESCKAEANKYSNWYIWTESVWDWSHRPEHAIGYSLLPVLGYSQRNGNYFSNYFWFQPALNYGFAKPDPQKRWQKGVNHRDCKAVRDEMVKIMRYWLDMGAAGFRCDMASSLIKGDKNWERTSEYWQSVRRIFDKEYPEAALIAEWFYPPAAVKAGFHTDFMADGKVEGVAAYSSLFRSEKRRSILFERGRSFFDKDGRGDITTFLDIYLKHYARTQSQGYISLYSGNHDFPRISIDREQRELEVVFAFLLTMPGVPFIYYGDEIGMRNLEAASKEGAFHRVGARTPMQWDATRNAGFSTAGAGKLYLPIDPDRNRPHAAAQEDDAGSLLNHVRRLTALRKKNPALSADGKFEVIYAEKKKYPFVYMRSLNGTRFIIALNPAKKKIRITVGEHTIGCGWEIVSGRGVRLDAGILTMEGISWGIFARASNHRAF